MAKENASDKALSMPLEPVDTSKGADADPLREIEPGRQTSVAMLWEKVGITKPLKIHKHRWSFLRAHSFELKIALIAR